jgi:hypothetical protein
MEWLVAIAIGAAALIAGVFVMMGKRDPKTAPYSPGVGRQPGGLYELGRKLREQEAEEDRRSKEP